MARCLGEQADDVAKEYEAFVERRIAVGRRARLGATRAPVCIGVDMAKGPDQTLVVDVRNLFGSAAVAEPAAPAESVPKRPKFWLADEALDARLNAGMHQQLLMEALGQRHCAPASTMPARTGKLPFLVWLRGMTRAAA